LPYRSASTPTSTDTWDDGEVLLDVGQINIGCERLQPLRIQFDPCIQEAQRPTEEHHADV
jgi:hypothetical protein